MTETISQRKGNMEFKSRVLLVGSARDIAPALFSLKERCLQVVLAGGVNEATDWFARQEFDVVITTLAPPLHSLMPTGEKHDQGLHGLAVATLATNYDPLRVAIISTDRAEHLEAEIVTETVSRLYEKTGGKVFFLDSRDFPAGKHQIDWLKILDHLLASKPEKE